MVEPRLYLMKLQHGELLTLLLGTVEAVIDVVATHGVVVPLPYRHDVDALPRGKGHLPVVLRHARHDVVAAEPPPRTNAAVLHPDVAVLLTKSDAEHGILHEDGGMGLAVVVHDAALVGDDVLQLGHRRDHLARRPEMVELTTLQSHDGHRQLAQLRVVEFWVCAQRTAEVGIEVVVSEE